MGFWDTAKLYAFDVVIYAFVFAFGACLGSLNNVLVYRLPRGLGVVTPPSRCPSCGTRLTWRENIPVLGWVMLRGKCRFCRSPISAEYPIVEAIVGLLFVLVYAYLFADPWRWPGSWLEHMRPGWAAGGVREMWPTLVIWLLLVSCLVAVTLVDAKTSMIPMELVWAPTLVGLVGHVGHAIWVQAGVGHLAARTPGWDWTLPLPSPWAWATIGAGIGGGVGVVVATLMLWRGWITRSFQDYPEWEKAQLAKQHAELLAPAGAAAAGEEPGAPPTEPANSEEAMSLWVQYPHARREVLREVLFLAPIIGLGFGGAALAIRLAGPWTVDQFGGPAMPAAMAPLWLRVLAGVLLGYLVGGGVVWCVRVLGSLGFGKEAMGLGDVHLMAAVGACLGWVDSVLAFFGAAFVGLAWWVLGLVLGGKARRAMPYGPYLAVSTLLVVAMRPLIERWLGSLLPSLAPVHIP